MTTTMPELQSLIIISKPSSFFLSLLTAEFGFLGHRVRVTQITFWCGDTRAAETLYFSVGWQSC